MIIRNDNITEASLGSASDLNASIFLSNVSAAGGKITPVVIAAVDTLFKDLKSNGIWDKILGFYPLIGGTSSSCAIEGKGTSRYDFLYANPEDAISGTITFSDNGIWSDLFMGSAETPPIAVGTSVASLFPSPDDIHLSVYSRTNRGATPNFVFGPAQTGNGRTCFNLNYDGDTYVSISGSVVIATLASTSGFFVMSKTPSYSSLLQNGTVVGTTTDPGSGQLESSPFAPLAERANIEAAFISFGLALTDAQSIIYTDIVQNFQTSLGRQV